MTAMTETQPHSESNCGIYAILSPSGRVYVGQSCNLKKRKYEHFRLLRNGKHTNSILQSSYDKYKDGLIFFVIERFEDASKLTEREQYWIDAFDSFGKGMNLTPAANSSLGVKRTEESKLRISQAASEFWSKEENRKAQSERKFNFFRENPEHLDLMSVMTRARFEGNPERGARHSELMKSRITDESNFVFTERMRKWRDNMTKEELSEIGLKGAATRGHEGAVKIARKGNITKLKANLPRSHNTSGVCGVEWRTSRSKSGRELLSAAARWTTPEGVNKVKQFSVLKYGLLPAFKMACDFKEKMRLELLELHNVI